MNYKPLELKVVRLLQAVEKHPELYKQCDQLYHRTSRAIKQKTWDNIARTSRYVRTEDAKIRWRGLLIYFRQILEDVARKKVRRYIPNTNNPEDKYVQLSDWRYYKYIKFMEPYIKISSTLPDPRIKTETKENTQLQPQNNTSNTVASTDATSDLSTATKTNTPAILCTPKVEPIDPDLQPAMEKTPSLPTVAVTQENSKRSSPTNESAAPKYLHRKVKIGNVVVDIEINSKTRKANLRMKNKHGTTTSTTLPIQMASPTVESTPHVLNSTLTQFEDLSSNDQNLRSFFDAMLKSAQRLPIYHQECVKKKLLHAVRNTYVK